MLKLSSVNINFAKACHAVALILTILSLLVFFPSYGIAQTASSTDATSDYRKYLESLIQDPGDQKRSFKARGLFDCEGAGYARVGKPGPSAAFVPVFDEAVHSHVQLLTYKECVLDKIASHNANAVLAGITSSFIKTINDQDLIIRDYTEYLKREGSIPAIKEFAKKCKDKLNGDSEGICAQVSAENLKNITDRYATLRCTVDKQYLDKLKENKITEIPFAEFEKILAEPGCLPMRSYLEAQKLARKEIQENLTRVAYEARDGFKPIKKEIERKEIDLDKSRPGAIVYKTTRKKEVVTPGSIVAGQLNLVLGSGLRRVESADEIDEMVQTFLANLSNRTLDAQNYGLYGMSRDLANTGVSYLNSLLQQEEGVAKQFRALAGGASLGGMITNLKTYKKYKEDTVKYILNAIHDLRNYENICFEEKIIPGAKEALASSTKKAACDLWQAPTASSTCPVSVAVNTEKLPDFLDIKESQDGNTVTHGLLTISGNAPSGSGTLAFINQDNKATSTTVTLSNNWSTEIGSDEIPDGDLVGRITYQNGQIVENNFYKKTIAGVPVLVLPEDRYQVKITATSSGIANTQTQDVVLDKNRSHSQAYTGKEASLTSTLSSLLDEIKRSNDTLNILYKIAAEAKNNTELANWRVEQLMSNAFIPKAADVDDAKAKSQNAQARMQSLVQDIVQDQWEANGAGWCNKDKWEEFKIN